MASVTFKPTPSTPPITPGSIETRVVTADSPEIPVPAVDRMDPSLPSCAADLPAAGPARPADLPLTIPAVDKNAVATWNLSTTLMEQGDLPAALEQVSRLCFTEEGKPGPHHDAHLRYAEIRLQQVQEFLVDHEQGAIAFSNGENSFNADSDVLWALRDAVGAFLNCLTALASNRTEDPAKESVQQTAILGAMDCICKYKEEATRLQGMAVNQLLPPQSQTPWAVGNGFTYQVQQQFTAMQESAVNAGMDAAVFRDVYCMQWCLWLYANLKVANTWLSPAQVEVARGLLAPGVVENALRIPPELVALARSIGAE